MLAFDIETTGLDRYKDSVTVLCAYGSVGSRQVEAVFNFARDGKEANAAACKALLDEAGLLCAFNGTRFDVPFLAEYIGAQPGCVTEWMAKLHDPCEVIAPTTEKIKKVKQNTTQAFLRLAHPYRKMYFSWEPVRLRTVLSGKK